jgi:hypothetical protein
MYSDNALSKILKSWTAEFKPPDNGKEKLLLQASAFEKKRRHFSLLIPRTQFNEYPLQITNEWSQPLFSFFFAQSMHASLQARL